MSRCSLEEVRIATGIALVRGSSRMARSTSMPSTFGILRSRKMTLGGEAKEREACWPRQKRKSSACSPSFAIWIACEDAYIALQYGRLDGPAREGVAFPLVKKLLAFNAAAAQRVEVVVLSKNDPVSGLRVFRSAKMAGLQIERGVFTRGRSPYGYLESLKANLFLSANEGDVLGALQANCPAARVYPESRQAASRHADELRIAFDGDAVLFSDEAERVYQRDGLDGFARSEALNALQPLPPGPFKPLLEALHRLQAAAGTDVPIKVRTALVTARSAPAHERAVRTLMEW